MQGSWLLNYHVRKNIKIRNKNPRVLDGETDRNGYLISWGERWTKFKQSQTTFEKVQTCSRRMNIAILFFWELKTHAFGM